MRTILALATLLSVAAAEPITRRFAADPSPHVFAGQVYLYATDDQSNSGKYWDSTAWRLYRSRDLRTWQDLGAPLDVTAFAWAPNTAKAWAPEAAYRNGRYYFYAPIGGTTIGVAVADRPEGPFRDARGTPLIDRARDANTGAEPIDPAVLVDSDGRAFLYFGTRTPKVVELAHDMVHTAGPIRDVIVMGMSTPVKYGEAPLMIRRGGLYYFSFSTGWPGQIAYATAASPLGPFAYRGIVLGYRSLSTNHHAMFEWRGRWWLFYHDRLLPGANDYRRALTSVPLRFTRDGHIAQVIARSPSATP